MKKLLISFIFLINLTQAGEYFLKEGDTILLSYGFSDEYESEVQGQGVDKHLIYEKLNNFLDFTYLYSFKNFPVYLKLGFSFLNKKRGHYYYYNKHEYEINQLNFYSGLAIDLWQNKKPFGNDNTQYLLLIGDLVTFSVDYVLFNFIYLNSLSSSYSYYYYDYNPEININNFTEENIFNLSLSTSWITKEHFIFGWGIIFSQSHTNYEYEYKSSWNYTSKEQFELNFEKYYLNFHLGYLF